MEQCFYHTNGHCCMRVKGKFSIFVLLTYTIVNVLIAIALDGQTEKYISKKIMGALLP